jgi:hypothetical protein
MITKNNLPALLVALEFHKRGSTYSGTWGAASIEVNAAQEEIGYPETSIPSMVMTLIEITHERRA